MSIRRIGTVWELRLQNPPMVLRGPNLNVLKGEALHRLLQQGLSPEEALRLLEEAESEA